MKRDMDMLKWFLLCLVIAGLTAGNAVAQVQADSFQGTNSLGTNYFKGNVGIGTTTPSGKLDVAGDLAITGGGKLTTPGAELVMEETGDTYGAVRLRLQNRGGMNGAMFESPNLDLVDFAFKPQSGVKQNIRYEHRVPGLYSPGNTGGEFQVGMADNPNFYVGPAVAGFRNCNVGVGTNSPAEKLHVAGNVRVDGIIRGNGAGLTNIPGSAIIGGGGGSGGLVATNNLSDVPDKAAARTNLGLGTAATNSSSAFATAAQGVKADGAVTNNQPAVDHGGLHTLANGNVGVGTATPVNTLDVAGNLGITGGGKLTTPGAELVMEEIGDTYGAIRLRLQNRGGMNGAMFESPNLDLVDFAFKPQSGVKQNIRYEHRSSGVYAGNSGGQFEIGPADSENLFVGAGASGFLNCNVGVGTNSPAERLHVAGNVRVDGIITGNGAGITNIAGANNAFLTDGSRAGNRSAWGLGVDVADIDESAYGSSQFGQNGGTMTIGYNAIGSSQHGHNFGGYGYGTMTIGEEAVGSSQHGNNGGTMTIGAGADGASQFGRNYDSRDEAIEQPTMTIGDYAIGSSQHGHNFGTMAIGELAAGASQHGDNYFGVMEIQFGCAGSSQRGRNAGYMTTLAGSFGASQFGSLEAGSSATNGASGAMQLLSLANRQHAMTTAGGAASLLLGAGTASNKNAIVAGDGAVSHGNGSVTAAGGFYGAFNGNGAGLTNISGSAIVGGVGGSATNAIPRTGGRYVVVPEGTSDTDRGAKLLAAYALAVTMNPTESSNVTVMLPPGGYDLGTGALVMSVPYVNIAGMVKAWKQYKGSAFKCDQMIYGAGDAVIRQTANNVRISDLSLRNEKNIGGPPVWADAAGPAAYFPDSNITGTVIERVRFYGNDDNNIYMAWSMRMGITYQQTFVSCVGGGGSFGGYGTASGSFIDCTGSRNSFASYGTASGMFKDCLGDRDCFGSYSGGTASGTFIGCTGSSYANFGAYGGVASGTFTDCSSGGQSFGFLGVASGTFTDCSSGNGSFGYYGTVSATAVFDRCRLRQEYGPVLDGKVRGCHDYTGALIDNEIVNLIPVTGDLSMGEFTSRP